MLSAVFGDQHVTLGQGITSSSLQRVQIFLFIKGFSRFHRIGNLIDALARLDFVLPLKMLFDLDLVLIPGLLILGIILELPLMLGFFKLNGVGEILYRLGD